MKAFKKAIIVGIGRAIGMIMLYSLLILTVKLLGITIDLSSLPPTLEGEIISSYSNGNTN